MHRTKRLVEAMLLGGGVCTFVAGFLRLERVGYIDHPIFILAPIFILQYMLMLALREWAWTHFQWLLAAFAMWDGMFHTHEQVKNPFYQRDAELVNN